MAVPGLLRVALCTASGMAVGVGIGLLLARSSKLSETRHQPANLKRKGTKEDRRERFRRKQEANKVSKVSKGRDTKGAVVCFTCSQPGHESRSCPSAKCEICAQAHHVTVCHCPCPFCAEAPSQCGFFKCKRTNAKQGPQTTLQAAAAAAAPLPDTTRKHKHWSWLKSRVVVTAIEKDYRRCVQLVQAADTCIELGCHQGLTTQLLARKGCPFVLGVEKSSFTFALARERAPPTETQWRNLSFLQSDALDVNKVRDACMAQGHDTVSVIFVDLSGSCDPGVITQVLEMYDRALSPRLFVVKNFKLENIVRRSVAFTRQILLSDHPDNPNSLSHGDSRGDDAEAAATAHNEGS